MRDDLGNVHEASNSLRHVGLTSGCGVDWAVQAGAGPVPAELAALRSAQPATVPGEVHTDLMAAGVVPDVFDGDNESALAWIGRTDWTYRAEFGWKPDGAARQELVAEGLDTIATVSLNGTELGRTANQHRTHRFDVTGVLQAGTNELVIAFAAPVDAAERLSQEIGPRPYVNQHPYNAIRKMASNYGWDWGPDVAGVGVWKPIRIESWSDVRIASVRPLASVDGERGVLDAHVELAWTDAPGTAAATVTVQIGEATATATVPAGQTSVLVTAVVEDVRRWWARGHGEQPLYPVGVEVSGAGGVADTWDGRVGFRTVTLDVAPDEHGEPFTIAVNGEPVYVRGANWIPDDAFVTRLTSETYRRGVTDAVDAGMNLLRVWGGGIYESEHFYRACDELGVLVWQDFLFACAAYAEEEPLRGEVEAEAREAVTRLSQHASLALWNGCNENIWGYAEWGWRRPLAGRSWGAGYYMDVLPGIVAELDPRTPYSPGSPYSFSPFLHPNDARSATMHLWDVWNQVDYAVYRDHEPRFAAEFGFQGPPAWSTLTSVVHDEPLDPYGPQMLVHQKAADGNGKLERGLGAHLPRWRDIDEWHWSTQLNQARAVGFGIEHFRSLFPHNTGSVVWQLNDNWPVISWAAVDGHGIRKPLWYVLRRVYADTLVTVQPRDGVPVLVVHNDSPREWSAQLTVARRRTGTGSAVLASETLPVTVGARSAVTVPLPTALATPDDPAAEFLQVGADTFWYFREDPELELVPTADAVTVEVDGGDVRVTATALVKDLCLFPDRLDAAARVDSGMVTLVAGGSHVFTVTGADVDVAALACRPVLRAANDLTRPLI
ncbi:glycoside hydrolase family 2 protein [Pseudonocardia sp. MH-G8]|uniref:glycoside hydrolase family 2 protein n=1 Tax=Pseudonocardia sp. MH-G8 TaxID=1854588 RepID=UPI000BA01DB5|nr:beta-mannosidase [Pseudonocardia sp. MH-G8]OZM80414.1 beta-mannosidase [Pseudonocardia sp. MH-G8]